ncbi:uncharacterized protein [Dysidea avara]|uniref:uncharacterized protein isoform X1 n=1 Tax=Dysidea avara TaxID=196820 RepID=UPI00332C204D
MAAGMSPVVVRISYGDGSNSESDATYAKLRDAIIEVVPHAQVSLDKSSIDLGSRNYFVVHVNNEQIEGDLPDIRANINKPDEHQVEIHLGDLKDHQCFAVFYNRKYGDQ